MKHNRTFTLVGVAVLSLSLVPLSLAQSQSQQPQPMDPTAQQPEIPPQSTPPTFPQSTKPGEQQPDPQQPKESQPDSQAPRESQQPSDSTAASTAGQTRTFMGTVLKTDDGYVLRSGDSHYKLDDQNRVKQFEGKDVKIMGNLDSNSNTIRVHSISTEPAM